MVEQTKPAPAGDEHAEAASVAIQAALEVINRAWLPAKPPLLVRAKRWLGCLLGFAASLALISFFALRQAPLLP